MVEGNTVITTEIDGQLGEYTVFYRISGLEVELIEVQDTDGEVVEPSFSEETTLMASVIANHYKEAG